MTKLINMRELSRRLTGNETYIRSNFIPYKHEKSINELISFAEMWERKNPVFEIQDKTKPSKSKVPKEVEIPKKNSQAKRNVVEVAEQDKMMSFHNLKPHIPNITYNGRCYRFYKWKTMEYFYFYYLDDAVEYGNNN